MKNSEIRELIASRRLKHYEVAKALSISEYTFSKWLRNDLSDDKKSEIITAILSIKI